MPSLSVNVFVVYATAIKGVFYCATVKVPLVTAVFCMLVYTCIFICSCMYFWTHF